MKTPRYQLLSDLTDAEYAALKATSQKTASWSPPSFWGVAPVVRGAAFAKKLESVNEMTYGCRGRQRLA